MCKQRVIIIGSGMGGLSCGVVLAKNGYQVTVLEQAAQPGGCLQCFSRRGARFETGMHFVGSARKGQTLDRLLQYLEIKQDILLSPLDTDGYDVVSLEGQRFRFANGREAFIKQMATYFPHQRHQLEQYFDIVQRVAQASALHSQTSPLRHQTSPLTTEYQLRSVNEVIDSIITDPLLANVLAGSLPLYAAQKDKTPFSTHAFIMDFYNQSAFRVVGGSDQIALSMVHTIERYDGKVLVGCQATKIVCDDRHATGVMVECGGMSLEGGEFLPCDYVISDAHPMRTLELIDSKLIRPAFRTRINSIPQTVGGFSVYLDFQDAAVPYQNYNFYGYSSPTPWGCEEYDDTSWPKGYLYMHFADYVPSPHTLPAYAKTGVIISYMQMQDVERWLGTQVGRRGEDYEEFKRQHAERLLAAVEQQFPGLRRHIRHYYTSTPLTYHDYTGAEAGGMYGVSHDINRGAACRVPHRTKIPNVLQTGQNINSHGILGVIVGTIVTCSELLTAERIYLQILEANKG